MEKSPSLRRLALPLLAAAILIQGCGPVLVGGAAVGASVIHDRRSSATVLDDEKIALKAGARISEDADLTEHSHVSVTSYNGVVLLVGQADSPQIKGRITDLVGAYPEVRRVVDEITIAPQPSLQDKSEDAYITSKVKLALFDIQLPDFDPTRVKVVTEQNVVYLMGLVTVEEAAAAVETARSAIPAGIGNIHFDRADVLHAPLPSGFDVVITIHQHL